MLLDRYVARHVLAGIAIVLAVLASMFFIRDLVIDLDDVGRGDFGYAAALRFVVMRLPSRTYSLLPASILIGGLLGLGWLARGSEITAMRAGGVSIARLVRAVMQAGAVVVAAGFVLGEWLAPWAERTGHDWRTAAITGQSEVRAGAGFWGRDGRRFFHLGEVLPDGQLRGVRMFEFGEDGALATAWRARGGSLLAGGPAPEDDGSGGETSEWRLEGVEISRFRGDTVETTRIESMHGRLPASAGLVNRLATRPDWLSLPDLIVYTRYLRENGLGTARYDAALWSRLTTPFLSAAMLFTAVALVLGPLGRASFGVRTMVGITFGIGFHIVQKAVTQMGVLFDWFAPVAAMSPVAALSVLGWWWLRRTV